MKITDILNEDGRLALANHLAGSKPRKRKPKGWSKFSVAEKIKWKTDNGEAADVDPNTVRGRKYAAGHENPYDSSTPDPLGNDEDKEASEGKVKKAVRAAEKVKQAGGSEEDQAKAVEKTVQKDKLNNQVGTPETIAKRNAIRSARKQAKLDTANKHSAKGTEGSGATNPASKSVQDGVKSGSQVARQAVDAQRKQGDARSTAKADRQAVQDVSNEKRGVTVKTPSESKKKDAERRKFARDVDRQQKEEKKDD